VFRPDPPEPDDADADLLHAGDCNATGAGVKQPIERAARRPAMIASMKRFVATGSLLACIILIAVGPAATQPASPLLARAYRMLDRLKATSYQHVTDIDEAAGEYHCDCSGLVSYLLRKEMPGHYEAVRFPKPFRHPRAVEFYEAFMAAPAERKEGHRWQRIDRLADAHPGDVVAWRKAQVKETGTTGHIVLLDSTPMRAGERLFEVVVIDSTSKPHKDDTRSGDVTGVGRGTIYLKTDDAGRAVAFATRSADGPFTPYAIAIGRPVR
jgi:hypothetical protein